MQALGESSLPPSFVFRGLNVIFNDHLLITSLLDFQFTNKSCEAEVPLEAEFISLAGNFKFGAEEPACFQLRVNSLIKKASTVF